MAQRRLDIGRPIALLGVILVLVSLFLDWFAVSGSEDRGITAWTAFEILDLLLAAIGIAAIAIVLPRLFGRPSPIADRWLPALGAAGLVIVVAALLNHPPAAQGLGEEVGAWLALAGAVLFAAGSLLGHARISFSMTFGEAEPPAETAGPAAPAPPSPPPPNEPPTERL